MTYTHHQHYLTAMTLNTVKAYYLKKGSFWVVWVDNNYPTPYPLEALSEKALEPMGRRVEKFFQKNFLAFCVLNFSNSN